VLEQTNMELMKLNNETKEIIIEAKKKLIENPSLWNKKMVVKNGKIEWR
jgi:hypothetical protein